MAALSSTGHRVRSTRVRRRLSQRPCLGSSEGRGARGRGGSARCYGWNSSLAGSARVRTGYTMYMRKKRGKGEGQRETECRAFGFRRVCLEQQGSKSSSEFRGGGETSWLRQCLSFSSRRVLSLSVSLSSCPCLFFFFVSSRPRLALVLGKATCWGAGGGWLFSLLVVRNVLLLHPIPRASSPGCWSPCITDTDDHAANQVTR